MARRLRITTFDSVFTALAIAVALLAIGTAQASVFRPMTVESMVEQSDIIVAGRVSDAAARYVDGAGYIITDVTIEPDELLLDAVGRGSGNDRPLTLSLWGGTVGDVTDRIAGLPVPRAGERILIFVAAGDGLDHVVGGPAGQLLIGSATEQSHSLRSAEGASLALVETEEGVFAVADPAGGASLEALRTRVREAVARRAPGPAKRPLEGARTLQTESGEEVPFFVASPEVFGARNETGAVIDSLEPFAPATDPPTGRLPRGSAAALDVEPDQLSETTLALEPMGSASHTASLPIVINQFPASITPWSPVDQHQMSKWNLHADVFRVRAAPTGTFGYPNGSFDLAGWPDPATLQRVYGQGWPSNVLAYTFLRYRGSRITEADIALNPAFGWTLDDRAIFEGRTTAQSFRATMLHELGHVWGAEHEFYRLSVMNYFPAWTRGDALLYADDATTLRRAYPNDASAPIDFGVYQYRADGYQAVRDLAPPSPVVAGQVTSLASAIVENLGPGRRTAKVSVFLTRERAWSGSILVGSFRMTLDGGAAVFSSFQVTVPRDTPTGDYYVGLLLETEGAADQNGWNNSSFSRQRLHVTPPPVVTRAQWKSDQLRIDGSNFQSGARIHVNGTAVPVTVQAKDGSLIGKGGKALKAMLPRKTAVMVTVVNPDGGTSQPVSVTRK